MSRELVFLLLGLGLGGAYALLTLGVVAIYRASGVPNFAQGAVAMISAFVFFDLRDKIGWIPAFVITVGLAGLLGVAFYLLVMRQLRHAPLMARIAATIGLLLLLQGLAKLIYPSTTSTPKSILPTERVQIGDFGVPQDRFLTAGIAIVLAIVLGIIGRRTRFGRATRAVAESEKGLVLVGVSPVRVAAINWAIAFGLAALAGILLSPIAGLDSDTLSLLIVPVFAAALCARFTSYGWAVCAALAIGAVQSVLQLYAAPGPWWTFLWTGPGRADAFPAVVVIVAMVVSGRLIPQRDVILRSPLPKSLEPSKLWIGLPVLFIGGTILFLTLPVNWVAALTVSVTGAIIALSIVIITGFGGQISLMQVGFAGLGAFVVAQWASRGGAFLIGIPLAAIAGALLGLLVGIPALRIRGQSLAIATLAMSLVLYDYVFINSQLFGDLGFLNFGDYPSLGPWQFSRQTFGIFCLVVLVLGVVFTAKLRTSELGHRALLVRESERSAIIAGVNVTWTKITLFMISATIAAIGGALSAYSQLAFSDANYTVLASLMLFTLAYIGGLGSTTGALIAGFATLGGISSNFLATIDATAYSQVIAGGALMISLQLHPDGLATTVHDIREARKRKRATAASPTVAVAASVPEGSMLAVGAEGSDEK